jgi:hypothetical protein
MAYSDFKTLHQVETAFGIQHRRAALLGAIKPVQPSANLLQDIQEASEWPVRSEKSRSEMLVVPVLKELRAINNKTITVYSGEPLDIDKAKGLRGECDFIIGKEVGSLEVRQPILQIVEAKKNDFDLGIPQCAAQMIGARMFNQQSQVPTDVVFGCVTTGNDWLFLKLNSELQIDTTYYYLRNPPELLGAFQQIFDYYRAQNIL